MKKALLLFMLVNAIICGYAQSTAETALPLQEGNNSYTFDSASGQQVVYYVYTAPESQGKLISFTRSESSVSSQLSADGTYNTTIAGMYTNNYTTTTYPVNPGQTVYLAVSGYNISVVEFTIAIIDANVNGGNNCDDAITLTENETFVPTKFNNKTYELNATYLTYTALEEGLLEITFSGSVSGCDIQVGCDGTAESITINNATGGTYVGKHPVIANTTYILKVSTYSPLMAKGVITHPEEGKSCDWPFVGAATNTLPQAAGTYWYSYTTDKSGFITLNSETGLAGGTLSIWSSCYAYQADASIDGYFALRTRVNANTTYLICVEKNEATATDETFTIAVEDEQAGDSEYNPIAITENEEVTLPQYNGTYYYSVTVPEGNSCFLIADATTANINNEATQVGIYDQYNTYTPLASGKDYAKAEVMGGSQYIIKWVCNEGYNNIKFHIAYEQIAQGETCNNPLTAVEGANDLAAGSDKYYTYTATQTGWLVIDTDITIEVTFLRDCNKYSGTYYATKTANITKTELKQGETCIIKFTNIEDETTFFLSEEAYAEGESCETATPIEIGITNIPDKTGSYWYKLIANQDGVVSISSDIIYEQTSDYMRSSAVNVKTSCDEYGNNITQSDASGTVFKGNFIVAEGDVLFINVVTISAQKNKTLTTTIRDLEPGESCTMPIAISTGELTLPQTSRNEVVWYSINLDPGMFTIQSTNYNYFSMYMYDSCDTENYLAASQYDNDNSGYTLSYQVTTPGYYYLKLDGTYNVITVTVSGQSSGIDEVAQGNNIRIAGNNVTVTADNNRTDVAIYDITGKVVASQAVYNEATFNLDCGIYIVKVGNKITKIAVH